VEFARAREESPESDIVNYNLGTALYKKGRYEEAAEAFSRALVTEDRSLEARAMYNLANSKYKLGSQAVQGSMNDAAALYREALDYYKQAMALDQEDSDAKYNHELVERNLKQLLDQMKHQQQNQENQQDQGQNQESQGQEGAPRQEEQGGEQDENQQHAGQQGQDNDQQERQAPSPEGQEEDHASQNQGEEENRDTMSEEEARMLLDAYGREKAREDVKSKGRARVRGVLKDW
jgi:tetratricopeptide (TPR) repeat protein